MTAEEFREQSRIAAYVRVSSRSQNHATQVEAIKRAAEARGDEIAEWFSEKASATKMDRPALGMVREKARRGEISKLYVFRLDRLSRTGIRDTLTVLEELRAAGCKVLSIADGFDLEGPAADVVIAVIAWAAQIERAALGERIAAARARVERRGGSWGRPKALRPVDVERIRGRAKKGQSIRQIAIALKIPRSTVAEVVSGKGAYAPPKKTAAKKPKRKGKPPASE
jgi:DNA invertase Pin-like site-specific DNA recombinase